MKIKWSKVMVVLVLVLVLCMSTLTGCGGSKIKGISVADGIQYQYLAVDTSTITVEYGGMGGGSKLLTETDGVYTLTTPCYSGNNLSVYIGDELYTAQLPNYVPATSVEWEYKNGEGIPSNLTGVVSTPNDFVCTLTYEDGHSEVIPADYASIEWYANSAKVTLLMGDVTFMQNFEGDFSFSNPDSTDVGSDDEVHIFSAPENESEGYTEQSGATDNNVDESGEDSDAESVAGEEGSSSSDSETGSDEASDVPGEGSTSEASIEGADESSSDVVPIPMDESDSEEE